MKYSSTNKWCEVCKEYKDKKCLGLLDFHWRDCHKAVGEVRKNRMEMVKL
jgi:uncharacterized protein YbdZ (MbtH family)